MCSSDLRAALNDECLSWIDYVLNAACCEHAFHNGVRDKGRASVTLAYFITHANAIEAGLSPAHVVALRIYTTHLFKYLNGPLRDDSYGHEKKPHPLPITMSYLTEGIKKLRAVYVTQAKEEATSTVRLWRGMRNLDVGDKFLADRRGGTEVAPMSTTTDMSVAVHYGLSEGSLLFLLKLRRCGDSDMMTALAQMRRRWTTSCSTAPTCSGSPPSRPRPRCSTRP